ncbi:hypothetical protein OJAV_G00235180 [Oryzias javanicus]|uniref:Uncharacterized protein n=1 Tax=Oryzias javanicus TaxID=123683 RepID=A0A3S2LWZ2_ORYJA|nr:hypothetical protein OJAV_G00235180 [Oryzias javanicus]
MKKYRGSSRKPSSSPMRRSIGCADCWTPAGRLSLTSSLQANIAEKAPDDGRVCMAEPFKFCVFQTSTNTDKVVADDFTKTVLVGNRSFYCGCTDLPDSTWFGKPVEEEEILSLFPDDMIKALHENLTTGKVRSNRMYLQNPMSSLPLKQHLKPRTLNLSDHRIFQLLRAIEDATGVRSFIQKEEIQILDHVFDVMLPEILISILTNQGETRLQYGSNNYRRTKRARRPFEKHGHLEPSDVMKEQDQTHQHFQPYPCLRDLNHIMDERDWILN